MEIIRATRLAQQAGDRGNVIHWETFTCIHMEKEL